MIKKLLTCTFILLLLSSSKLEEGMFPLSEISNLNLKKAGLKIKTSQIFNPTGVSLVNALVRVGGCTGSFISDEGLIITNHHCAFGAVAAASTPENDYITHGFHARQKSEEIKTSIKSRITESYEDVSERVLQGTESLMPAAVTAQIEQNIKSIEAEEKQKHPELLIEISEMLQGKIYTLFRYRELNDIRLVYVPPRSVGEFGGESDNWVWPRHTGDFSFMRAYVAPDGSAAEYSENNVPYKPKMHLKINAKGTKENDFVFILGYPGRTYRNQPSQFLEYQYKYVLPYISEWYDFQIESMEKTAGNDKEKQIAYSSRIKSLSNVTKNFKGKMQGLRRTDIIEQREADDKAMKELVASNPDLQAKYGNVLEEIEGIYNEKMRTAKRDLWLGQMFTGSGVMFTGAFLSYHNGQMINLGDKEQEAYMKNEWQKSIDNFKKGYKVSDKELEKMLLKKLLLDGVMLDESIRPESLNRFTGVADPAKEIDRFVDSVLEKNAKLLDREEMLNMYADNPKVLLNMQNPLFEIAAECHDILLKYQDEEKDRQDKLNVLIPKLTEIKQLYKKDKFIPDANSTLRFTYGHVRGYFPADAEYHHPFTGIKGILQKANSSDDYYLEDAILQMLKDVDPASVVCILYDLDTTGGNSGSPILDGNGDLVGVNFDRAFTATINDYAWNEEYSRSIGVDIRYVILILKELAKAESLLKEMGVS